MAAVILTAAGLGFLGLGAQPPLPEWGAMISDRPALHARLLVAGRRSRASPSCCVSLAFNLLGDGLRDVLDPKQRMAAALMEHAAGRSRTCASAIGARRGDVQAVRGVSFTLGREKLGIVGEIRFGQVDDRPRAAEAAADRDDHRRPAATSCGTDLLARQRAARCSPSAARACR